MSERGERFPLLVRRNVGGHEVYPPEIESLLRGVRQRNMSQLNGIKRSTKKANIHEYFFRKAWEVSGFSARNSSFEPRMSGLSSRNFRVTAPQLPRCTLLNPGCFGDVTLRLNDNSVGGPCHSLMR